MSEEKVCRHCGGTFVKSSTQSTKTWKQRIYCDIECQKAAGNARAKVHRDMVRRVIAGEIAVYEAADMLGVTPQRICQIRKEIERGPEQKKGSGSKHRLTDDAAAALLLRPPARVMAQLESDYVDWSLVSWDVP